MAWHEGAGEMAQTREQHLSAETHCGNKRSLSGGSDGKESAAMRETGVRSLGGEDPLAKRMAIHSLGGEDPLAKRMAIHSSNHVWRIPWTEEPGSLQCMGSQELDTTESHTFIRETRG